MGSRYTKYDLEHVTDYLEFESFCHTLMARVGYENIEPLGGFSDKGRDAIHVSKAAGAVSQGSGEVSKVSGEVSKVSGEVSKGSGSASQGSGEVSQGSGEVSQGSGEVTIFAYSVREDWKKKLGEDLDKIRKHSHKCDRVVFVTTANPTDGLTPGEKDRSKASVLKEYGWQLDIYDLERIATLVDGPNRDLARMHPGIFVMSQRDSAGESEGLQKTPRSQPFDPRIFISYARRDGQGFADSLRRDLEKAGFAIWQDIASMQGGRDWWEQISQAIKQVEYLVMVMTPGALESKYTAMEWKLARQEGTCVLPVLADDAGKKIDFSKLPHWMRHKHFVNTATTEQWTRFIRTLEGPARLSGFRLWPTTFPAISSPGRPNLRKQSRIS